MEQKKVINLSGNTLGMVDVKVPKFRTEKGIEFHDQLGNVSDRYKPSKQISFKTSMLQLDLCGYSDLYIVVRGTITVTGTNNKDRKNRSLVLTKVTY